MKKVRITKVRDFYNYPLDSRVEIYNHSETKHEGDRQRWLYMNEDDVTICDDGGGFFVDQRFIDDHVILVCVPESILTDNGKPNIRTPIPPKLRYEILERGNSRCVVCGTTAKRARLEVDHIVPVSKGGTNDPSNLQVLCVTCNQGKGAKY